MESNAFVSLSNVHLPSSSRFVASSCCPDKDLVVCLSRIGGTDRISLWNSNQGFKVWDVGVGEHPNTRIVDIAWSPDGQSIAVAHDPFQISIHSLQDGLQQTALPNILAMPQQNLHINAIQWFQDKRPNVSSAIPDIFQRGDVITGTAHSILQSLPLLDNLQEDSDKLTATDLFAFQGSQTRSSAKSLLPEVISGWPILSANPIAASIRPAKHTTSKSAVDSFVDVLDDSNVNSILVITDDHGHIHFYLDGTFPLGVISLGPTTTRLSCLLKHNAQPVFYFHRYIPTTGTDLQPTSITMPLLGKRHLRELAKLSSTTRELVWYTMRIVKDMRTTWFGSESTSGAREFGPQWVRALEAKQKGQFGQEDPNPILDLTRLLVSGRASEPLLDFLGSGEQMSERALQKWEATVTEALVKLRECSEKSVSPACQRLHLVLEELRGWAQLPQYRSFQLSTEDLDHCLELTRRSIIIASWLAAVARRELSRFKDFISWLRFETSAINPANESTVTARHDILEVNNYFISGLVVSSIDKWFLGPVPHFHPRDLGIPGEDDTTLLSALERARAVAGDPDKLSELNGNYKDMNHLDRNLDALIQELAMRCQRTFTHASGAPCRSAIVPLDDDENQHHITDKEIFDPDCIKERIEMNENDELIQHIALCLPSEIRNTSRKKLVCIAQHHFKGNLSELSPMSGIAFLECCLLEEANVTLPAFDLLAVEFFDDECVVVVYRLRTVGNTAFIATLNYNIEYQRLDRDIYVSIRSREAFLQHAKERWRAGQLNSVRVPIKQCRALTGFTTGNVTLAVNGRAGRRVACVLDSTGTVMESFDLEGDVEDMEVADDGREP